MPAAGDKPPHTVFASAADFRVWLEQNHANAPEIWVGYYKKGVAKPSMKYLEGVDEALCFGWIDGQIRSIDEEVYANRYTPRRPRSTWSATNVQRMTELITAGRAAPAGIAAFEARTPDRTGTYRYDRGDAAFPAEIEARFRANEAAWAYWEKEPPGYRRQMTWWVMAAKRDDTRERRLNALIAECAAGRRVDSINLPSTVARKTDG